MLYFQKLFKLPSPVDLGMSKSANAMPSRLFCQAGDVCWEDYYDKVKQDYPVRYFLSSTMPELFISAWRKIYFPIKSLVYWVKYHTVCKRHLLDLRQPTTNTYDDYRYGWRDTDTLMLFALFNLLNTFVNKEFKNFVCPSEEECNDPMFGEANRDQRNAYFEIVALHNWWNVDRKNDLKEFDAILKECSGEKRKWDKDDAEWDDTDCQEFKNAVRQMYHKVDVKEMEMMAKEEEMLVRLIKVRRWLWS